MPVDKPLPDPIGIVSVPSRRARRAQRRRCGNGRRRGDRPVTRWVLVVALMLIAASILDQGYQQSRDLVRSQRGQCQAAVPERQADAEAWYAAARARRADAVRNNELPSPAHPAGGPDWQAAQTYLAKVARDMLRLDAAHSLTWPDPAVPGQQGPFSHPLGLGSFSCARAYPEPSFHLF